MQINAQSSNFSTQLESWYQDIENAPEKVLLKIDSLLENYKSEFNPSELTQLYHIKSDCHFYLDDIRLSDEAIKNAIALAPEHFDTSQVVEMYNSHGQNLDYLGEIDKAIVAYEKGLHMAKSIKDSISVGNLYHNLGLCHFALLDMKNALEYIDSSQQISISLEDETGLSSLLRLRSSIFSQFGDIERAVSTSKEGLKYHSEEDPSLTCFHFLDIANCYYKAELSDSIYKYALLGKACSEDLGYGVAQAEVYKTFGNYYMQIRDTINAVKYYDSLTIIAQQMGDTQSYYHGLISQYTMTLNRDEIDEAIKATQYAEQLGLDRLNILAYSRIAEQLYQLGDASNAYKFLKKSGQLEDNFIKEENRIQSEMQAARFNLYTKEAETRLAKEKLISKQAQFLNYGMLGLTLFVITIGGLIYRNKRSKLLHEQEKMEQETQLLREIAEVESQALRAQMNPHFIFNALNSIKGLIITKKDKEAAVYISKFSKLVRNVLEYSSRKVITLKEELDNLVIYVKLEQMRFRDGFHYHIEMDDDLRNDEIAIPPITLQPFVENAIWHGFKNNTRNNELVIKISKVEEELHLEIMDNGVGIENAIKKPDHKSHGLRITKQRINNFSNDHKKDRITIKNRFNSEGENQGTSVRIRLPIKYVDHE